MLDSSLASPPMAALNPLRTWALALAPSEKNYTQIARDPKAGAGRAYLWLAMVFVVGGGISAVVGMGITAVFGLYTDPWFPSAAATPLSLNTSALQLVCGVPIVAVGLLIGVTVLVGLSHVLGLVLGGQGTFARLLYTYAAFYVPVFIVDSFLQNLPYLNLLLLATSVYALLLSVVATKSVQQFGWVKAALAGLLIPLLSVALAIGLVVGGLAYLTYLFKYG